MARDGLAQDLADLIERYRHSALALETFVSYSFEGIAQQRSRLFGAIENIDKVLRQEMILTDYCPVGQYTGTAKTAQVRTSRMPKSPGFWPRRARCQSDLVAPTSVVCRL
jgi:hypothetical protein